jgi:hypothetical protein
METILCDKHKFQLDDFQTDLTQKIEKQVKSEVTQLRRQHIINESTAKSLTPTGTCIPRLYGLPKVHKENVPLRPILSMVNTPTYELAKFINHVLQPVRNVVSSKTIQDSFDFVNRIRSINLSNTYLCSFDISSLFTNVPLDETIAYISRICEKSNIQLPINVEWLTALIRLCTQNIQFRFNDKLYFQHDGVAMGSPLGPTLADIFVGYLETFVLQQQPSSPVHYFRYVDDTFAVFASPDHVPSFLDNLNSLHSNLKFTHEVEVNNSLPFLDVLVHKTDTFPLTSIYRKPTWTGLYLHFLSYVPVNYKRNLVTNLFSRASKICSPIFLEAEKVLLHKTLVANGYPPCFIDRHSKIKTIQEPTEGPEKKIVFLFVPFHGDSFSSFLKHRIRSITGKAVPAASPVIIFNTRRISIRTLKDQLPTVRASNLVYKFSCGCGSSYVGRTRRMLADRVAEHLPGWLLKGGNQRPRSSAAPQSAVTRHVISCDRFDRQRPATEHFSILTFARSPAMLPVLEATHIVSLRPDLCNQKDFVFSLALPWQ